MVLLHVVVLAALWCYLLTLLFVNPCYMVFARVMVLADVMVLAFIMLLPRVMLLAVLWCYL